MKTTKTFTSLLFIILIINACSKGCPEGDKPFDKGVDKTYLPYIIPYTDTSTRLFLKNGKDTLLFKSQGLKETIEMQKGNAIGNCKTYKLQQYSLKMAASDTDFFEIRYYSTINEGNKVLFYSNLHKTYETDLSWFVNYKIIQTLVVLNNKFDSVSLSTNNYNDKIYSKLKFGIIKIENNNVYEIIK